MVLSTLTNEKINFKNNKNIEQIYFNIISPEKEIDTFLPKYIYNELYLGEDELFYSIYYLLTLKYFNRLIPNNIRKIGVSYASLNSISIEKIRKICKNLKINNI